VDENRTALWAFPDEQVAELTGLSARQIRYWRVTDFYVPSAGADAFYSFRDIVALRTVAALRSRRVPLQELRRVGEWLKEWSTTPWASLRLHIGGRKVYFQDPVTGAVGTRIPKNQTALPIALEVIASEALSAVERSRERKPKDVGQIQNDRRVMGNAATVRGTRVPTAAIWDLHEDGDTDEQIQEQYPRLTKEDIAAALNHERELRARGKKKRDVA
jgi:uncharacterized protein (DUF433 family)